MKNSLFLSTILLSSIASAATPVDGWYGSAFGGYTYVPGHINQWYYGRFMNNDGYDSGYNAGLRYGYQSNPIRYEVEYTYLNANAKHVNVHNLLENYTNGSTNANVIMANIYYDTPEMLPAIAPFLGIGIGFAHLSTAINSYDFFGPTYYDATDNLFAYQGTAGLTYNFSENYAVNVAYRYLATTSSDTYGKTYQAHLASAGVIYRFDQGNYK